MKPQPSFGQWVRERRRELGLTQDELARRVGCAPVTVRKIEYDDLRPSVQIAERLAMALNLALEERAAFVRQARSERPTTPVTPTPSPSPEEIGLDDLTGRSIRGYELGELIGKGGFGVVYRAVQPLVEREVAIKIILPQYANHPDFIRRFEAEAQLVARLEHPHIVPLYDYWREPSVAYLVMRLLRGNSLDAALKNNVRFSLEAAGRFAEQIGSALYSAHRAGVIHRDLKPANILFDEDGNTYLTDFGIAKNLGSPEEATDVNVIIGSPAYFSPEQILAEPVRPHSDIYSLGLVLYEFLTGRRARHGPTPLLLIQQHLNDPLPSLADGREGLPPALDAVIQRATAKDPAARYPDVPALLADFRLALDGRPAAITQPLQPDHTEVMDLSEPENPYKGLRAFAEGDAADFFGREALIHTLLSRLSETGDVGRFLAVVGPSGSGKSSVVRAGVIPALREGAIPGSEKWFIVDFVPGAHPLEELEAALLRVAVNPPESLLAQLREGERGLLRAAKRILPADEQVELLLLIDQFEELFTLVSDEAERVHFLNNLVTAVLDPRSRVRLLVTLRADFMDRPLQYVDFGEVVRQRNEFVLPLTADELEQAITGPAERAGLQLETGLAGAIVRELSGQPGGLPLLQYALSELFERRNGRLLTKTAYQEIGGVAAALGRRAEALFQGLRPSQRPLARQLFLRLTTLNEGSDDVRRRVAQTELEGLDDTIWPVVELFGKHRLLSFDRDPTTRQPTVEVAHEALLREWPRLRDWLAESRDDIRRQRLLADAAAQWQTADRDPSFLLSGSRLAQFEGWAAGSLVALTQAEYAYLQASVAGREAQHAEEELRRQRELETAHQLVATEKARAEEQSQSNQRLRQRALYLSGALVVAAILAVLAFAAFRQADTNSDLAENSAFAAQTAEAQANANADLAAEREAQALDSAALAQENADLAATRAAEANANASLAATRQTEAEAEAAARAAAETIAIEERETAQQQTNLATSRELSLAALNNLESDAELSMLLALQALETTYTKEAEEALHQALQASRTLITLRGHSDWVGEVAFSPNGSQVATSSNDGTAKIWDRQSGELLRTLTLSAPNDFLYATLDYDDTGSNLATLIKDAEREHLIFTNWDALSGETVISYTWPITTDAQAFYLLSPDQTMIAVDYADDTAALWEVATGQKLLTFPTSVLDNGFSPDGSLLATGNSDGQITIWDWPASLAAGRGQPIVSFDSPNSGDFPGNIAFNRDLTHVALGFSNGSVEIWDLANTGRPQFTLVGLTNVIFDLEYSPDQTMIAAGGVNGVAAVWDTATGELLYTLAGHKSPIAGVVFSPDGQTIATASDDSTTRIWKALPQADGELLTVATDAAIIDLELSPDEQMVAVGSFSGPASVWDANTGQPLLVLPGEPGTDVYSVAFRPNSPQLATTGEDNVIRVWDLNSGEAVMEWTGHGPAVGGGGLYTGTIDLAYSPDGTRLATAGSDGFAKVWDADTAEELLVLSGHTFGILSIVYSHDGRFIATSQAGSEEALVIKIWDAMTGQEIQTLVGHERQMLGLDFDLENHLLATSGFGGAVNLWDLTTSTNVYTFTSQVNTVGDVLFTPDQKHLITSGGDALRVWDVATRSELLALATGHWAIDLSQDGRRIYAGDFRSGVVRVFVLPLDDAIALARSLLTRTLTAEECRQYLHMEDCPERP